MSAIYGPDQEHALIRSFFGNATSGWFVDVGANDPIGGSQSWHLEQRGWRGVLVEPLPAMAAQLRSKRASPVYEVACSSPAQAGQKVPLYVAGAFSSLSSDLVDSSVRAECKVNVQLTTLDEVLRTAQTPREFEFLSIDVEGHEIEVLSGVDLRYWSPRLVLIEDHAMNLDKHRAMRRQGYRLVRRTGLNAWYVPQSSTFPIRWWERLSLFRKYVVGMPFRRAREAVRHWRHSLRSKEARLVQRKQ